MLRMVNALLDVYKLEEGRLEAVPQAIRLEDLVLKSISQVKPEARAKNITVTSAVGDATVFVDDGLIVRVLTNLLANAVKHTPAGGNVRVEAHKADEGTDFVLVRVTDTGPGITNEDAPNVFDRFYQGGTGRSRGGTGLGLAFCRLAVALHGGTIRVANPGQPGATIDMTLPAAAADHVAVPA
jgi:signal transduction histidine kinase